MKVKFGLFLLCGLFVACSQSRPTRGRGHQRPDPPQHFARLDTDQSGGVSFQEFQASPRKGKKVAANLSAESQQNRFARLDANSDGQISLAEFKSRPAPPQRLR